MPSRAPKPDDPILAVLDVGVIVQDSSTRLLYANAAAARLLGVSVEQATSRDSYDPRWIVTRADGTPFETEQLPVFEALRSAQPVRGVVMAVQRPAGDQSWLRVDAIPLLDEAKSPTAVVMMLTDITGDVQARLELQRRNTALDEDARLRTAEMERLQRDLDVSESTYSSVLRAMAEGIAVHALDGSILFANPAAERILGLTIDQMQGRYSVDPAWHLTDSRGEPLAPAAIPSEITRLTGQSQRNVVLGVQTPQGERRWLSVNTDAIDALDTDGFCMVVATFTDITIERAALSAAETGRQRLLRLTDALPGAVFELLVAPDGTTSVPYASAQLAEIAASTPHKVFANVRADDRERLRAEIAAAASSGSSIDVEFHLEPPGREPRELRLRAGPPSVTPLGPLFGALLMDVTESRRIERALRETQRREGMGLMAAGIAHNFNNMLAAILPNLERLRNDVADTLRAEVDDAYTATQAATELVRQLMMLTRREQPEPPSAVDLRTVAEGIVNLCRRTFDRRIQLSVHAPDAPVVVLGRQAELQQVMLNLCLNARDAMAGTSAPVLRIELARRGAEVVVSISDNGVGMTDDELAQLGNPFFTTKAPGQGTGLGVATAIGIVRDFGGTLTWHSTLGRGTTFTVVLPAHGDPAPAAQAARMADTGPGHRGRVLIVDDEDLVRRSLGRTLTRLGFEVLQAEGGARALALLAEGPPVDVALIDQNMPGMSGTELYFALRQRWPTLPILIVSGIDSSIVPTDDRTGALLKPFDSARLLAAIDAISPRRA
jgi:PAS domain S-box-containing protein